MRYMGRKSKITKVPIGIFEKADDIKKNANFKNRTDAFNFMGTTQPIILDEKSIRLPKSKNILKQIDVRYFFKEKIFKEKK